MHKRDPASVLLDPAARQLLTRAYNSPGRWQGTRLADPDIRTAAWLLRRGINWRGKDNASASGRGGLNARDRWMRALVRALYYQHKWYSPSPRSQQGWRDRQEKRTSPRHAGALRIEIGRRLPVRGIIPAGRAIRVMYDQGGQKAQAAARRLPERDRIYDDRGDPAARWSDPMERDWA